MWGANRSPPDTTAEDFYSPARDAHLQAGREEDTKPAGNKAHQLRHKNDKAAKSMPSDSP
jgi:hypothetical protein